MKRMIVVGASGHGREVAFTFLLDHAAIDFAGFLDDAQSGTTPEGWPIIGKVYDWQRFSDCEFVVGVNDPRTRRGIVVAMQVNGSPSWGSVVHPEIAVHPSVKIGHGTTILGGVAMTVNIALGNFVNINRLVALGHDCKLGDFVSVAPLASISGNVTIGSGAEIGTSSAIRQQLSIGAGSGVGMGSVVTKSVPPNTLVVGNPARTLRELEPW